MKPIWASCRRVWSAAITVPVQLDDPRGRLLQENESSDESIYTSTAFVIWYCVLIVGCCLGPIICVYIQCYRIRNRHDHTTTGAETQEEIQQRREEVDRVISRVEANVHVFSQNENRRRKRALQCSLRKQTIVLTAEHFSGADDEMKALDVAAGSETDSTQLSESLPRLSDFQLSRGCSICLGRYKPDDVVTRSSSGACQHVFHQNCIVSWLSTRSAPLCPVCRQPFCREQLPLNLSSGSHSSSLTSSSDTFFVDPVDGVSPPIITAVEEEGGGSSDAERPMGESFESNQNADTTDEGAITTAPEP